MTAGTRTDRRGGTFRIRPLRPDDRPALDAMYDALEPKRGAQGLPPGDAAARRRWLDALLGRGWHLVVDVDGAVRGHGMLIPFEEDGAELANFLHQDIRDRGIGTALNRALIERAKAGKLRRVWLSVEPSNRAAVRSYLSAGFRHRPETTLAPELEMVVELEDPPRD